MATQGIPLVYRVGRCALPFYSDLWLGLDGGGVKKSLSENARRFLHHAEESLKRRFELGDEVLALLFIEGPLLFRWGSLPRVVEPHEVVF